MQNVSDVSVDVSDVAELIKFPECFAQAPSNVPTAEKRPTRSTALNHIKNFKKEESLYTPLGSERW